MKLLLYAVVLGAFAAAAVTSVSAQDLSMCTSNGVSVSCCQQSFKQYGPFGGQTGAAKEARMFDLRVCQERTAQKKLPRLLGIPEVPAGEEVAPRPSASRGMSAHLDT
jgi:hypothetical protein